MNQLETSLAQGVVARGESHPSQVEVGLDRVGVQLQSILEGFNRRGLVALLEVDDAQVVVDTGIRVVQQFGLLSGQEGHVVSALVEVDPREVPVSRCVRLVFQEDGPALLNGCVVITCAKKGLDEVVADGQVIWGVRQVDLVDLCGLIGAALAAQEGAQVEHGVLEGWLCLERVLVVALGRIEVAKTLRGPACIEQQVGVGCPPVSESDLEHLIG